MGGSEYRNTANKIEQTPHHRKKYYQHTDTAKFTLSKCFFFKRQYHYFYFSNTRNTSQDIPIAFSVIINTWQLRWAKEVTAAKWYDSVYRYLTDTWPILDRHLTDTWPIHDRYLTDTWPTLDRYMTDTSPVLHRYLTDTSPILDRHLTDTSLVLGR